MRGEGEEEGGGEGGRGGGGGKEGGGVGSCDCTNDIHLRILLCSCNFQRCQAPGNETIILLSNAT